MKKVLKIALFLLFLFFSYYFPVYGLMSPVLEVDSTWTENRPVFAGEIFQQSFVSQEEEFGAVGIKVDNNNRLNDDFWIFRIKEEGEEGWYFETKKYITDFQSGIFYPIGFPKIINAKGKKYIFEIESEKGKEGNQGSVFLTSEDIYKEGEVLVNGKKIGEDLVFAVYKEDPAEKLIKNDFIRKLKRDPFFISFWILVLMLLMILLITG